MAFLDQESLLRHREVEGTMVDGWSFARMVPPMLASRLEGENLDSASIIAGQSRDSEWALGVDV
jgi:hypothetical protein